MSLNKRAIASRADYINKGSDTLYVRDGVSPMTKYIEYGGQNWEYADDYATPTDLYHIYTRISVNKASGKKLIGLALVPHHGGSIFGFADNIKKYFTIPKNASFKGAGLSTEIIESIVDELHQLGFDPVDDEAIYETLTFDMGNDIRTYIDWLSKSNMKPENKSIVAHYLLSILPQRATRPRANGRRRKYKGGVGSSADEASSSITDDSSEIDVEALADLPVYHLAPSDVNTIATRIGDIFTIPASELDEIRQELSIETLNEDHLIDYIKRHHGPDIAKAIRQLMRSHNIHLQQINFGHAKMTALGRRRKSKRKH